MKRVVRNKGGIGGEEVMELGVKGGGANGRRKWWRFRVGFDQEGRLERLSQEDYGMGGIEM